MKLLFFIFILTAFLSCETIVVFDQPQPVNVKRESQFNKKYWGTYIGEENTLGIFSSASVRFNVSDTLPSIYFEDTLMVYSKSIVRSVTFRFIDLKTRIDSASIKEIKKDDFVIDTIGDTIIASGSNHDTIFRISQNNILKEFRRKYT